MRGESTSIRELKYDDGGLILNLWHQIESDRSQRNHRLLTVDRSPNPFSLYEALQTEELSAYGLFENKELVATSFLIPSGTIELDNYPKLHVVYDTDLTIRKKTRTSIIQFLRERNRLYLKKLPSKQVTIFFAIAQQPNLSTILLKRGRRFFPGHWVQPFRNSILFEIQIRKNHSTNSDFVRQKPVLNQKNNIDYNTPRFPIGRWSTERLERLIAMDPSIQISPLLISVSFDHVRKLRLSPRAREFIDTSSDIKTRILSFQARPSDDELIRTLRSFNEIDLIYTRDLENSLTTTLKAEGFNFKTYDRPCFLWGIGKEPPIELIQRLQSLHLEGLFL
ncbi:MAG: hypothetical protein RBT63_03495 [Bdellovibrionales bacterium]|jgi:hypothetical protein|nr:hypothetical protein [Bdellovibrionales bacterium]